MKYATSAALSLVLSLGLAAAAQAQGVQPTSPPNLPPAASQTEGAQPQGQMQETQPGTAAEATSPTAQPEQLSASAIKGAQRALKEEGLYQGKIDGVVGPETHQAVAEFQQRNNMEPTGDLSADTVARLTGVGVGSSTPNVGSQPETTPGQPMPGTAAEPTPPAPGGGNGAPTAPGAPAAR